MLMKTSTSSTQYHHHPHNHYDRQIKSSEPRLKIKISRLKDGTKSFSLNSNSEQTANLMQQKSLGLTNISILECDTNNLINKSCSVNADENVCGDDSDETEEEDNVNSILKSSNSSANEVSINVSSTSKSMNKKLKIINNFPESKLSFFANNLAGSSYEAAIHGSQKLLDIKSIGNMTDANLLGPCQPGTCIKMPGLIWTDSAQNGMLLFKTTWKNQVYSGMLVEVAKEDWSFPKSRIFASCPGSRYKRKCKKPKEFNYIDSWKKRSRNAKQKARALRNLLGLEEFASINQSPNSNSFEDAGILLPCLYSGCYKKFTSFIARQFHVNNSHSVVTKLMPPKINQSQNEDKYMIKENINETIDTVINYDDANEDATNYIIRNNRWRKNTLPPKQTSKVFKCFENSCKKSNRDHEKSFLQSHDKVDCLNDSMASMQSEILIHSAVKNEIIFETTSSKLQSVLVNETGDLVQRETYNVGASINICGTNNLGFENNAAKESFENLVDTNLLTNTHIAHEIKKTVGQTPMNSVCSQDHISLSSVIINSGLPMSSSSVGSSALHCVPTSQNILRKNILQSTSKKRCSSSSESDQPFHKILRCSDEEDVHKSQHPQSTDYFKTDSVNQSQIYINQIYDQIEKTSKCDGNSVISLIHNIPSCKTEVICSTVVNSSYAATPYSTSTAPNSAPQINIQMSTDDLIESSGLKEKVSCSSPVYSDISDTVDETPLFVNPVCDVNDLSTNSMTPWKPINIGIGLNSPLNKWLVTSNSYIKDCVVPIIDKLKLNNDSSVSSENLLVGLNNQIHNSISSNNSISSGHESKNKNECKTNHVQPDFLGIDNSANI